MMSHCLFSLEATRSTRASAWRYEIPLRMCLKWLVVRPRASLKPTAELLTPVPDILTAALGARSRLRHLNLWGKTHIWNPTARSAQTHTLCVFSANTPSCFCAYSSDSVNNERTEVLNKQQARDKSFSCFFFLPSKRFRN